MLLDLFSDLALPGVVVLRRQVLLVVDIVALEPIAILMVLVVFVVLVAVLMTPAAVFVLPMLHPAHHSVPRAVASVLPGAVAVTPQKVVVVAVMPVMMVVVVPTRLLHHLHRLLTSRNELRPVLPNTPLARSSAVAMPA